MKKAFKILVITILSVLLLVVALGVAASYYFSDDNLRKETEEYLCEALNTQVRLRSVRLQPFNNAVAIYGFDVKDKNHISLLHVDTLEAKVDLWQLINNNVTVEGFNLAGAYAVIYKEHPDSAMNYQFIIDAIQFKDKNSKTVKPKYQREKAHITLDLRSVKVSRTGVKYDINSAEHLNTPYHKQLDFNHLWITDLNMKLKLKGGGSPGNFQGELKTFSVIERNSNTNVRIKELLFDGINKISSFESLSCVYQDKKLQLKDVKGSIDQNNVHHFHLGDLYFHNDNGKPRKNVGRPNRGAFDPGHIDANLSLDIDASYVSPDSVSAIVHNIKGKDASGLKLDKMSFSVIYANKKVIARDMKILVGQTSLSIPLVNVQLPDYKKEKHTFRFNTSVITGRAVLQDIAQPFAPALAKFTTPLYLTTKMSGTKEAMRFDDICVRDHSSRLIIKAKGGIDNLDKKRQLTVWFDVLSMSAQNGITDQIIRHFKHKPAMMSLVNSLGDIAFTGRIDIPWKQQLFKGRLTTEIGKIDAQVRLDGKTKYLDGTAHSDSVDIGKLVDSKKIGKVGFSADFKFDIMSKRMAKKLGRKKGRLPAGYAKGVATNVKYGILKAKSVDFNLNSDGFLASGTIYAKTLYVDLYTKFSFDDTDFKKRLKIQPKLTFHKMSAEDKQERRELKERRKEEKREQKAQKKAMKQKARQEMAEQGKTENLESKVKQGISKLSEKTKGLFKKKKKKDQIEE